MNDIEINENQDNIDIQAELSEPISIDVDLEDVVESLGVDVQDDPYQIELSEQKEDSVEIEESSEKVYFRDYNDLDNKPSINEVVLVSNKSFEDLGLVDMTNMEIENLLN